MRSVFVFALHALRLLLLLCTQNLRRYIVAFFFLESTCKLIAWKRENMSSFLAQPFLPGWLNSRNPFSVAIQPLCLRSIRKVLTFNYCSTFRTDVNALLNSNTSTSTQYVIHIFPFRQNTSKRWMASKPSNESWDTSWQFVVIKKSSCLYDHIASVCVWYFTQQRSDSFKIHYTALQSWNSKNHELSHESRFVEMQ